MLSSDGGMETNIIRMNGATPRPPPPPPPSTSLELKPTKQISEVEEKTDTPSLYICPEACAGILEQSVRAGNRAEIGLSYRLHRLAESIP